MVDRANAQTEVFPGKWWMNPRMARELKLTEAEKQKLDDNTTSFRRKAIDLKKTLEKERFELDILLGQADLNEAAVIAQYKKMEAARAALSLETFTVILEVRKVLGAERFERLKEIYRQACRTVQPRLKSGAAPEAPQEKR